MASIIKQAIIDILDRLKTVEDAAFVAFFNNQLERMDTGEGYSIPLPALLVEIIPQVYNQLGVGVTQSDIIFRIHIAHQEFDAMDGNMDQNLNVFDLRDQVKVLLSLFKPTNCTPFMPVNEEQDYAHTNVYHYTIDFLTGFIDTKGSPLDPDSTIWIQSPTPLELDLTVEYPEVDIFDDTFNDVFA